MRHFVRTQGVVLGLDNYSRDFLFSKVSRIIIPGLAENVGLNDV